MKVHKHIIKKFFQGVLAICSGVLPANAQTGNHVFAGAQAVNFGVVHLATPSGKTWSTFRGATPGYFSAVGNASYTGAGDVDSNVNGYVRHYANAANQTFSFPVGTGTDYRELVVSGVRSATADLGVAWIVGDPSGNLDPTGPNAGAHSVASFGTGITAVSSVGQWDWQDLSGDAAGSTVSVSIPDMTAFAAAPNLRLVGWDGTEWVNLSGTTGSTGNTENSTLSGTMIAGITALGIGAGEISLDYGDGTAFTAVYAEYTDSDNDGTPDGTGSVWLGTAVSADLVDASNSAATGDASGDDGFGLPPTTGGTIDHTVTLSGVANSTVHYAVRFVPSSGAPFTLTGSHTFGAAGGSTTVTLSPSALVGFVGTIDYRVVAASSASDAAAAISGANFTNGEIEDYQRIYTNPLPVELMYLKGAWKGEDAVVEWATASEVNSSHFDVERSFDGVRFEYIATLGSKATGGNSNEVIEYSYTDMNVLTKTSKRVYYRLVQTDFDGENEVFGPTVLNAEHTKERAISIFPVPARDYVTVQTKSLEEGDNYTLRVIDNLGKTVQETAFIAGQSYNNTILDISNLPYAVYWIVIEGENLSLEAQKLIKVN